jgi:hypothetical protein
MMPEIIHARRAFFLFSFFSLLMMMLTNITLSMPSTTSNMTRTIKLIKLSVVNKYSMNGETILGVCMVIMTYRSF